jgi:glycosyltransferase involved in cell wall biosynthesis
VRLAAIVITRNEEKNIERCLKSVAFCDEIIVVDSESQDKTRELAARFTTRVYERKWQGYSDQKNYALSLTECEWVLSIDADEEISDELKNDILSVVTREDPVSAYSIRRKTIHLGRWIRYGGWYPNQLVRLFKPKEGQWEGPELHESWKTQGQVSSLKGHLLHYSFEDLADQVARNNHYSTLGARQLRREGKRFSGVKLLSKPIGKFLETYLVKRGFLDGYPGFIISVSAAYSVFLKWSKLWELELGERKI